MNYLAHLWLSDPSAEGRLGNLMADLVKGPAALERLPAGVRAGVALHRKVDAYTDCHPSVQAAIRRISPRWGWFSGVILDVFFDYLLIRAWDRFADEPLDRFIASVYGTLRPPPAWLEGEMAVLADRLVAHDRLTSYGTWAGIEDTLFRVSQRVRERMPTRALPLEQAVVELAACEDELAGDFGRFFPDLARHAAANGGRPYPLLLSPGS